MSRRDLPTYVERGGELVARHPSRALDVRLYGFPVVADVERLDELCRRTFNEPSGFDENWRALGPSVLLTFVDIPTLESTDRLDRRLGSLHEQEAAIWVPVEDVNRARSGWTIPYMFVDSHMPMVSGRETYGFAKQLGG